MWRCFAGPPCLRWLTTLSSCIAAAVKQDAVAVSAVTGCIVTLSQHQSPIRSHPSRVDLPSRKANRSPVQVRSAPQTHPSYSHRQLTVRRFAIKRLQPATCDSRHLDLLEWHPLHSVYRATVLPYPYRHCSAGSENSRQTSNDLPYLRISSPRVEGRVKDQVDEVGRARQCSLALATRDPRWTTEDCGRTLTSHQESPPRLSGRRRLLI